MIMNQIHNNPKILDKEMLNHLDTCLQCRGCETVCPSGVEYYSAFKGIIEYIDQKKSILTRYILKGIKNRKFLNLLSILIIIGKKTGILFILSKLGFKFGIQGNAIPIYKFRDLKKINPGIYKSKIKSKGFIGLYTGCIMNEWFIDVHKTTIRVLNKLGYDVFIPEIPICCGAMHNHSGQFNDANQLKNIGDIEFSNCDFVIVNSAGCGAELNSYKQNKIKYIDIIEFLFSTDIEPQKNFKGKVLWDAPCHLIHAQNTGFNSIQLFEKLGIELVEWHGQDLCCGGAGNYTLNHTEESNAILNFKYKQLLKLNFEYLVTSNPGCYLQLEKGRYIHNMKFKVIHFIEIIDRMIKH